MRTIFYLVHDTNDAAVAKRVAMFRAGGAQVELAGFRRRELPADVGGVVPIDLGRTADARLIHRAAMVLRRALLPGGIRRRLRAADVVVARNLEALAIAVRAAAPGQRIVFECLDIHRLLLSDGRAGRLLRALERRLLARTALLVTSSPAFVDGYFSARRHYAGPMRIEENRVLAIDGVLPRPAPRAADGVIRIGWFGMLRCRRSLAILTELVRRGHGRVEVMLAGVPSYTEFDDFDRDVAATPGLRYLGRYTPADLPRLYGDVDLAWAIDYFEAGLNSTWLLPNRLYESLAFGVTPIAAAGVETARWLDRHGVGLVLDDPASNAADALGGLTDTKLAALRGAALTVPAAAIVATCGDCAALTQAVLGDADG